jgi:hypothetical protein
VQTVSVSRKFFCDVVSLAGKIVYDDGGEAMRGRTLSPVCQVECPRMAVSASVIRRAIFDQRDKFRLGVWHELIGLVKLLSTERVNSLMIRDLQVPHSGENLDRQDPLNYAIVHRSFA